MNDTRNSTAALLGRYQPISDVAKSPIGGLVMAFDMPERRVVALRSLPIEGRVSSEVATQLLEAGRWVKGLDDSSVMTPLEVGTQEGMLHAVFSFNLAEPLRGVLRLASFRGSPMPVGVALRISHDVVLAARAIEACGASPVLGDSLCGGLIPDSILVGQDGKTRLCDAGIAAILRRTSEYGQHPEVLGYASPEQVEGAASVDGRSDVFSIGVCLWEMLSNRRLFSAPQAQAVATRVKTLSIAPLDSLQRGAAGPIPAPIVAVVKRALERSASERYPGTTALLQALETQCCDFIATPEAVQHYMTGLLGNIFETRSRAIERAIAAEGQAAGSSSLAPPGTDPASANLNLRPRGVTSNIPPPATAGSVGPSSVALAKSDGYETLDSDSLAPDTVRDPVEERPKLPSPRPRPMPSSRPAPLTGRKPPLPPIPTLPQRFELPGAALFATPGMPSVKTGQPQAEPESPPQAVPPESLAVDESRVKVGPTISTPPAASPAESKPEPKAPSPTTSTPKSRIAWVAVLSFVGCAFLGGIALRRCTLETNRGRVSGQSLSAPASVHQDAASLAALSSSEPSGVADAAIADAAVLDHDAAVLDAGAPSASIAPKPPPVRHYVRRSVPRSSSKVVRGHGKTTVRR